MHKAAATRTLDNMCRGLCLSHPRKPHAYSNNSPFQHQLRWIQKNRKTCVVDIRSDWNCFQTVFRKHLLHSPQTDVQTQAQLSQTSWIAQKQALCRPATYLVVVVVVVVENTYCTHHKLMSKHRHNCHKRFELHKNKLCADLPRL